MGISSRDYMRDSAPARTTVRPSLPPHLQREAPEIAARNARRKTRRTRIGEFFSVLFVGLGILVGIVLLIGVLAGTQYWLLEHSTMSDDWRMIAFFAVTSVEVCIVGGVLGAGDNLFGKLISFAAGLAQAFLITMILLAGAHLLGVDFSVIEHHEITHGRGIPVLEGLVEQTPWWYLLLCAVVTGVAFYKAQDADSVQWIMGTSLPFFGSVAYLIGKFALDTGNWGRWF